MCLKTGGKGKAIKASLTAEEEMAFDMSTRK
jgi:hypothetical protein